MSAVTAREKIRQAALHRFWSKGYLATGVDQIIADAGVSKGSFYHAYKSKEALGLDTLEMYFNRRRKALSEGAYNAIEDPVQRALGFIDHTANIAPEMWNKGCLMGNFATAMASSGSAFKQKLQGLFRESEDALTEIFEPVAACTGEDGPSARELAVHYLALIQGVIQQVQVFDDSQRARNSILGFRRYLEGLIR